MSATAVRDMFRHCTRTSTFSNTGLGVVSFCQSWALDNEGRVTDAPCFSVASPHFQTRFYVRDGTRPKLYLAGCVNGFDVVDTMFMGYLNVIFDLTQGGGYLLNSVSDLVSRAWCRITFDQSELSTLRIPPTASPKVRPGRHHWVNRPSISWR